MKSMLVLILAATLVMAAAACAEPPGINYQEGQWEITTMVDIPGMPKEMNRPHVFKTCLSRNNPVPRAEEKGPKDCKMVNQSISGNTVTWKMACKDGTTSEGKITYAKASYEGTSTTTTSAEGRKMVMKSSMKGRYLGPCPSK